jgi:hypothetical protein
MNAERALRDALAAAFAADGFTMIVEDAVSRPWASATFSGRRHELTAQLSGLSGLAAPALIAGLGERQFDLKNHVLIDIAVTDSVFEDGMLRLTLEALTVVAD